MYSINHCREAEYTECFSVVKNNRNFLANEFLGTEKAVVEIFGGISHVNALCSIVCVEIISAKRKTYEWTNWNRR